MIPNLGMQTSVAAEMVATGSLREIENRALRESVALLPAIDLETRNLLPYWRSGITEVWMELWTVVDYQYAEDLDSLNPGTEMELEALGEIRVKYDITELASNRKLKNMFFELVDVQADLLGRLEFTCDTVKTTRNHLMEVVDQ